MIMRQVLAAMLLASVATPGFGASPDAWEAFREDVEAACIEKAAELFEEAAATVDPFGSESYGLVLLHGKAKGADTDIRAICVFDKQSREAEIGGELPAEE